MRIAVNVRALGQPTTGVQRYAREVLNFLDGELTQIAPKYFSTGVKGHMWEQLGLPFLLKKRLLWSPCNTGPLMVSRQVVTIHDISPIDHPEWMSAKFSSWYRFLTPRLTRRVLKVLTDSEFTKQRLIDVTGVDDDKVIVIPLGVDKRFQPTDVGLQKHTLTALNAPTSSYILTLSSLEPRKNLKRLLEAWARIVKLVPDDVWLYVAGAKGSSSVFRELKIGSIPPRVHFLGRVDDEYLPALYGGAIAFAYMSEYEGFGLPPLEAMACETPVIASNTTSLPEVVGDAGILASPYDIDAIAEGMLRLVDDTDIRTKLGALGRERARNFTWTRTAQLTRIVLENAAGDVA